MSNEASPDVFIDRLPSETPRFVDAFMLPRYYLFISLLCPVTLNFCSAALKAYPAGVHYLCPFWLNGAGDTLPQQAPGGILGIII